MEMKRLFILTVVLIAGVVAQAAPKVPVTLDEYIATAKAKAEKAGKAFDEEKVKKNFAKKDANGDGTLSVEEQMPAAKAAPAAPAVAPSQTAPVAK